MTSVRIKRPPRDELALPCGATPVSRGIECRLVTPVNVLDRFEGDPCRLGTVRDGDKVEVTVG